METKRLRASALAFCAGLVWFAFAGCGVGSLSDGAPAIDDDDIGGVVTGPEGTEAGVWVIAETHDLPTPFARIVVTDDAGRYVVPDLPAATYDVWVRGYGLVDSPKQQAEPGAALDLEATPAPDVRAAAEYYPAGYWLSLLRAPDASEFPGTGPEGNGFPENIETQEQWLRSLKSGSCTACHLSSGPEGRARSPRSSARSSLP